MTSPNTSFEALAAQHGFDVDAMRAMAKNLLEANQAEARWRAWCAPLIDQARKLDALGRAHDSTGTGRERHALSRPNLHISVSLQSAGETPHFDIRMPGEASLSFKCERFGGIYLSGYWIQRTEQGAVCGSTNVIAQLEKSWFEQSDMLREHWLDLFGHAGAVMQATEHAVVNDTPLEGDIPWDKALVEHLRTRCSKSINPQDWQYWVARWGTPEMVSRMNMVDTLFDPGTNPMEWKTQLLRAWEDPVAAPSTVDPGIFAQAVEP